MTLRDLVNSLWSGCETFGLWLWHQPSWIAIMVVVGIIAVFWWLVSLVGNR